MDPIVDGRGGPERSDEWFLTNGLGGFASGSTSAIADRRYHAWLIAALNPPVGRFTTLNSCAERVEIRHGRMKSAYDISTHRFAKSALSPDGVTRLKSFSHDVAACWSYATPEGVTITRTLTLARHMNAAAVEYAVEGLPRGATASITISPLVSMRDFHELLTEESCAKHPHKLELHAPDEVFIHRFETRLHLKVDGARFEATTGFWERFEYARDAARGQDSLERLYCPGRFIVELSSDRPAVLRATVGHQLAAMNPSRARELERQRLEVIATKLSATCGIGPEASFALAKSADDFIVRRRAGEGRTFASIIAGYPWFSDWGRDTCISLPGLLLHTGRHEEAFESLCAFGALRKDGLIPNCFDNGSGVPEYNTVDAPLWFIQACCSYFDATADVNRVVSELLPACRDIVAAYLVGTRDGIAVDAEDGLVKAGDPNTQLTWMDARRDGVVFTPRHGKPVEINALWCSSLRRLASMLERIHSRDPSEIAKLRSHAESCARSMREKFIRADGSLIDTWTPGPAGWTASREIRPNQIFAVSLPEAPFRGEDARKIIAAVERELLTPVGLRTLSPDDPGFRPRFNGTLFERDRAYHNGTVWPWLIGPFAEAVMRADDFSPASRSLARSLVAPLLNSVAQERGFAVVHSIPEIFDATAPHRPDGCPAQAWSVAEVIRVLALSNSPVA